MSSIQSYFATLPKEALPITWKRSSEPPPPKRVKRGPGRPKKTQPQVIPLDFDSENVKGFKRSYSVKQKKAVVAYAKNHSVAAAARSFSVPRTTVARWMEDGYFMREVTKRGVKKGAGRPLSYSPETDEQLLVWVLENCDLHLPITIPLLQAKALEIIAAEVPNFKASSALVLRARTSMAQELPATLEERIRAFHRHVKRVAEINRFELVGNMDETLLYFDVVPGRVLDKKGKRSVVVRSTGNEKRHLTVVLTVLADGVVLPAYAIFKGRKQPQFHEVGVFIRAQEKAWMDEAMMLDWIDSVWELCI